MWKWQAASHNISHKIFVKNGVVKGVVLKLLKVKGITIESYVQVLPLKRKITTLYGRIAQKNRLLDKFLKLSFLHVSWLNEKLTYSLSLSLSLSLSRFFFFSLH